MKKILLASLASLALASGSALAADLPAPAYKAPPPPPPSYSWTGCYINAGWGYGMWNQDHYAETSPPLTAALVPVSQSTTDGGRGWLGTVGGGCDFQASRWVLGAFADYDFMNLNGTNSPDLTVTTTPFFVLRGNEKESGAWSVGARLGYLVTPSLLTYVNGGYTQTRFDQVNFTTNFVAPGAATGVFLPAHTYNGWFIGGGTEYALNMDWLPIHGLFLRSEYRYSSYQSADIALICTGGGATCGAAGPLGVSEHAQKQVQTISTSLVWRFNTWGPVSTRY